MLNLPIHRHLRFLLVSPHYPENLGAACRAAKTMGFSNLALVSPGRLARPEHPMAQKMAVKSWDVLDNIEIYENLDEALVGSDLVIGTTAKRGMSGVLSPAEIAPKLCEHAEKKRRISVVLGNEKTGLTKEQLSNCDRYLRIPIAADQPSLNLAQAVQIISYEFFKTALALRESTPSTPNSQDLAEIE